ncbi:MAG: ATP-binding protein [Oscillospiraceae bacterium]
MIGNAARFAKSEIIICLQQRENLLLLSVTDDGPGYPAELVLKRPKTIWKTEWRFRTLWDGAL